MPERIQLQRKKGWKMPPNTARVDRGGILRGQFGNPFLLGVDGTAEECVEDFRKKIEKGNGRFLNKRVIRAHLAGKNLACWCKIGAPCHADVLLEIANATD